MKLVRGHEAKVFRTLVLCIAACFVSQASATDNWKSETSHAIFGASLGGAFTWGANYRWPEHRALIGFGASAAVGLIGESAGTSGFSALDAGAHVLGAAIGAALTDEFLLAPVIKRDVPHSSYIGVILVRSF
jgi:hypothetical protein